MTGRTASRGERSSRAVVSREGERHGSGREKVEVVAELSGELVRVVDQASERDGAVRLSEREESGNDQVETTSSRRAAFEARQDC